MKLTRLVRIAKLVKKKSLAHQATKVFNMDSAMERLLFFLFGTFFMIHILLCLGVSFAQKKRMTQRMRPMNLNSEKVKGSLRKRFSYQILTCDVTLP